LTVRCANPSDDPASLVAMQRYSPASSCYRHTHRKTVDIIS